MTVLLFTFRETLINDIHVLTSISKNIELDGSLHGYNPREYYQSFKFLMQHQLTQEEFIFIDSVHISNYGFSIDNNGNLISGQNNSSLVIEDTFINPFTHTLTLSAGVQGYVSDVDIIASQYPFQVNLRVVGCLKDTLFWEQSLYQSYYSLKSHNKVGSFMHLFIALEGYLRWRLDADSTEQLHDIFEELTNQNLPKFLKKYRKIRNQIMHGNENIAKLLADEDILFLLSAINDLYKGDSLTFTVHKNAYTEVLSQI